MIRPLRIVKGELNLLLGSPFPLGKLWVRLSYDPLAGRRMRMSLQSLDQTIRQIAREEGIDLLRITSADPFEGYPLRDSPRRDPRRTLPGARSLIVAAIDIAGFSLPGWDDPSIGRTSRLFLSGFFCNVVKPLGSILSFLRNHGFSAAVCDEFEPNRSVLPLKLAAVRAGIGWQGKNSLLISPDHGSFLALGGMITDALLELDVETERDRCGSCRACQEACPMGAISEPYRLNRKRCLSHLLSEKSLPWEALQVMGNRVLDCEICQLVCPWNKRQLDEPLMTERIERFRKSLKELTSRFRLSNLVKFTETDYARFIHPYRTAVPYTIFRRNVIAALGHSGEPEAIPFLRSASEDPDPETRKIATISLSEQGETNPVNR